jgi:hypothetical protein
MFNLGKLASRLACEVDTGLVQTALNPLTHGKDPTSWKNAFRYLHFLIAAPWLLKPVRNFELQSYLSGIYKLSNEIKLLPAYI